jgi:hypothetical protein
MRAEAPGLLVKTGNKELRKHLLLLTLPKSLTSR